MPLEIDSLDALNHSEFVVHFSDQTYGVITAEQIAACVEERKPELIEEEDV